MTHNGMHFLKEKKKIMSIIGMFYHFLVLKARLSLQVHNNCHLCCHGISGGNQTLLGVCWKSSGKGNFRNTDSLVLCIYSRSLILKNFF